MIIKGLEPILAPDTRILILGSMPSEISLEKGEYYANPRNHFWKIICSVCDTSPLIDYKDKVQMLLDRGIGLWDVLASCERQGSLDANIRNEQVNDFEALFREYKKIKYVLFNGAKAYEVFEKKVGVQIADGIEWIRMPSTSPANTISFDIKLNTWSRLKTLT